MSLTHPLFFSYQQVFKFQNKIFVFKVYIYHNCKKYIKKRSYIVNNYLLLLFIFIFTEIRKYEYRFRAKIIKEIWLVVKYTIY